MGHGMTVTFSGARHKYRYLGLGTMVPSVYEYQGLKKSSEGLQGSTLVYLLARARQWAAAVTAAAWCFEHAAASAIASA